MVKSCAVPSIESMFSMRKSVAQRFASWFSFKCFCCIVWWINLLGYFMVMSCCAKSSGLWYCDVLLCRDEFLNILLKSKILTKYWLALKSMKVRCTMSDNILVSLSMDANANNNALHDMWTYMHWLTLKTTICTAMINNIVHHHNFCITNKNCLSVQCYVTMEGELVILL